jgi:hypothetical protein
MHPRSRVDHLRFLLSSDDIAWILDNECAKSKFADVKSFDYVLKQESMRDTHMV